MTSDTALDFYELRRAGIGRIEATGSAHWTDYNVHDPGITILEALSYAITDLGYRTGFPIADLIASSADVTDADQTFFSARRILTVDPTTPDDLRRQLIDVDEVRNAWVLCKTCGCDAPYFAWCEDDELRLSHDPSERPEHVTDVVQVEPRGLLDVLLDLESDNDLGPLNDRAIVRRRTVLDDDGRRHIATVEAWFPAWPLVRRDERQRLAADDQPIQVTVSGPNRTITGTTPVDDAELRAHWFDPFYVDVDVELSDGTVIPIENVAIRLFGDATARDGTTVAALLGWLADPAAEGFVDPYRRKLAMVDDAVRRALATAHAHRSLGEDICAIDVVDLMEIAACADVEVDPTADIELVQARIWYEVERYLDPPIEFRSLDELLADGVPVESIFDGPELANGFVSDESLRASELRSELRVSDLLDRLVDIEGVISVERLQLTAYGADGTAVAGISDPTWSGGARIYDPTRISASWLMHLPPQHRPRLHRRLSRFLFAADGLPFLPRTDEAEDLLVQLHGQAARPKLGATDLDLPVPAGRRRDLTSYRAVQHGFPEVYGIGPVGLPTTASTQRRAHATQLKAYLMVFEQLLRNAHEQIARLGDLFSLDDGIDATYFSALLTADDVVGHDDLVDALTEQSLQAMVETDGEFIDRRNRFLDHLLARFAESFGEFARVLASVEGAANARAELIGAKLAFLRNLPELGHDRGRAFDRTVDGCDPDNVSGLQQRINLRLGLPDVAIAYHAERAAAAPGYAHRLDVAATAEITLAAPLDVEAALEALIAERALDTAEGWTLETGDDGFVLHVTTADDDTTEVLGGAGAIADLAAAVGAARRSILASLTRSDHLAVRPVDPGDAASPWEIAVDDPVGGWSGTFEGTFPTDSGAQLVADAMSAAAAHARSIVVEHLLLRPKFPGDALYPACSDGACCMCGDEDPYSFRLTYVAPGWTAPLNTDMRMRDFADRTVQRETPSHLLAKSCWVGNDGFVSDPCDPVVGRIATVLDPSVGDPEAACDCAVEIHERFAATFRRWFDANAISHLPRNVVADQLAALFAAEVDLADVACAVDIDADVRGALDDVAVEHFVAVARRGYQFERFADAWCRWLAADGAIDWPSERLQQTVEEILSAALADGDHVDSAALCRCAATILARFGSAFREWMLANIADGLTPDDFAPFVAPAIESCPGLAFDATAINDLRLLLAERYGAYVEVSYRLQVLVDALADLRNTYPPATLHDCDEGSDFNPVRLGQTALGSN